MALEPSSTFVGLNGREVERYNLVDEIHVVVNELSWREEEGSEHNGGIYKLTFQDLYDVYKEIHPDKTEDDWWSTYANVGLDNRWYRLSTHLYHACLTWKRQGKQVTDEWESVQ